jgi:YD repeat-containing protein
MESVQYMGTALRSYTDGSTSTNYAYAYDGLARLKSATATSTGSNAMRQAYTEAYSHSDAAWADGATIGNLEKVTVSGVLQQYDYSSDRAIMRTPASGALTPYASNPPKYVYDHAGRMTSGLNGASELEGYAYDVEDHLKAIRSAGVVTQLMEYGPEGELLYRKEGLKAYFYVGGGDGDGGRERELHGLRRRHLCADERRGGCARDGRRRSSRHRAHGSRNGGRHGERSPLLSP